MDTAPNFEIVVGTYEEFLLGYKLSSTDKGIVFNQTFATHSHAGSIRCVASSGRYLASGSVDDRVVVYDMITRRDHCMLNHHNATINCVEFTVNHSHVICASDDGVMSIVRVGNWQVEKLWSKPHKGSAIRSISAHPTGKLALTLGSDYTLRTWNLVKGRQAYAVNLATKSTDAKSLDLVKWNPDGVKFILGGGNNLEIWSIKLGGILHTFKVKARATCACWLSEDLVASGHEDGTITVINIKNQSQFPYKSHTMRVKALQSSDNWLVSASSDGFIKLWRFDEESLTELGKTSTGCRCTSLALVSFDIKKEKKSKNKTKNITTIKEKASDKTISDDEIAEEVVNVKEPIKKVDGCKVIVEFEEDKVGKKRKSSKSRNKKKKMKTQNQGWAVEDV